MANPTQPEQQKIDPIRVKNFWPGPITIVKRTNSSNEPNLEVYFYANLT